MKHLAVAVCLGAALITGAGAAPVAAQGLSRIIADTGLSPEDFSMMSGAARTLYDVSSPRAGSQASWSNPATGSNGVAHLDTVQQGCVVVRHIYHPKGAAQTSEIRNRLCKATDGKWVMQP